MTARVPSWRITVLAAVAVTGIAVSLVALTASSGAPAALGSSPSPSALYPALKSTEPSGITLVANHNQPHPNNVPTFPETPPTEALAAEHWPIASSIRRVTVSVPGVFAWISESYGGGVCVLAWDGGTPAAVGFSCSPSNEVSRGASLELRDMPSRPGKALTVGVAPVGKTTTTLPSDPSMTVSVSDDAWAYETTTGAKG
jgi:hypothetical protein